MNVFAHLDSLENTAQRVGFNSLSVPIIQICFPYTGTCHVANLSFPHLFTKIGVFFKLSFFLCPADVNECKADMNPCFNGGTCFDLYGTYECLCAKGWGGPQCNNGKSITNLLSYDLYCYQICLQCSGIEP